MKKQLRNWLAVFVALIMGIGLQAQEVVTVGSGTTTAQYAPYYSYYNYSASQTIYLQEDIQTAGTITEIGWYSSKTVTRSIEISLAEVSASSIASISDAFSADDLTIVFEGSVASTANGWTTVTLDQPFVYTGSGNLVVAVRDHTGSYVSAPEWRATAQAGRTIYFYTDNYLITWDNCGSVSSKGSYASYPDIQLTITPLDGYCAPAQTIAAENITATSALVTWTANEDNSPVNFQCTTNDDTDWENATTLSNLTVSSAILESLSSNTLYKVRVQSICGEGEDQNTSSWKSATFRTECESDIPYTNGFNDAEDLRCWSTPITYTVSNYYGSPTVYPSYYSGSGYSYEGAGSVRLQAGDMNLLVSPQINQNIEDLRISFFAHLYLTSSSAGTLEVGLMTDPEDLSTFESVALFDNMTNNYGKYIVNFNNAQLTGTGKYIAFLYISENSSQYYLIDNVVIEPATLCNGPAYTSLVASNVNYATADIAWEDNNAENTSWVVSYIAETEGATMQTVTVNEKQYSFTGLAPETQYTVFVHAVCQDGSLSIDSTEAISFTTRPLCYAPDSVSVSDITTNSVTVSWRDNSSATAWTVYYKDASASEWSEVPATEKTLTINGLTAATSYTVKVKGNCSDEGNESSTVSFKTPCDYISIPYTTSFEDDEAGMSYVPSCWTRPTGSYPYVYNYSSSAKTGSKSLYWSYNSNLIVLPAFNTEEHPINTLQLSFYGRGSTQMQVGVVTDPNDASTFEIVSSISLPSSYPTDPLAVNFTSYIGEGTYIAMKPASSTYVYVDDVTIDLAPTCYAPVITEAIVDGENATVNWNDNSTSDSWTVSYKDIAETEYTVVNNLSERTYTFPVVSSSSYQVKVQGNCGEDMESAVYTFKTSCEAVNTFPYEYGFEDATTSDWGCWDAVQVSNNNWSVETSSSFEGTKHAYKSWNAGVADLMTPIFDLTNLPNAMISYNYKAAKDGSALDTLYVYYKTSPTAEWVELAYYEGMNSSDPWASDEILLPNTSSSYQIKFRGATHSGYGVRLDNVKIFSDVPTCKTPQGLAVSGVSVSGATVSWSDNGTSTAWTVYYKESSADTYTALAETTENTADLTGLVDNTNYTVYVKGNCSEEAISSEVTFKTKENILTVNTFPYNQDFEGAHPEFNVLGSGTNAWAVGTAAFAGEEATGHSLYVSNDEGETYEYSNTATSNTYAVVTIDFGTQLEYEISFDWMSRGESSNWDRLMVYLANEEVNPTTINKDNSTNRILNQTTFNANPTWQHFTYTATNVANQRKQLIFYWYNDGSGGTNPPAAIDNISIVAKTCYLPTALTADEVTSSSAQISWTEVGESTSWTLSYKKSADEDYIDVENLTTPSYALTNLESNTSYSVKVKGNCSDEAISSVYVFTTPCGVYTLPFTENFDDMTGSSLPACWSKMNGAYNSNNYQYAPYLVTSGEGKAMELRSNSTSKAFAVTPDFGAQDKLSVSFSAKPRAINGRNGSLQVGLMTDPTDTTTFVLAGEFEATSLSATTYNMLLVADAEATENHVAFRYENNQESYYYLVDDINITTTDFAVTSDATEGEETYTFTLAVTEGFTNVENSGIEYKLASDEEYIALEGLTLNISDLEVNTAYDYRGYAELTNGVRIYSLEGTFTTPCVATTIAEPLAETICANGSYTFFGEEKTEAGTYTHVLEGANQYGCDSTVTLVLTVNALNTKSEDVTVCYGTSYTFNGETWNATGTYTTTVEAATENACDTVYTINLTVLPQVTATESITVCYGGTATFNGTALTEGANTITVEGANGDCDTLYTVTLTILPQVTASENVTLCYGESYTFNGETWNTAGEHTTTVAGLNGDCDTLYTVTLTILPQVTASENVTLCYGESYTFNGETWNTAGEHTTTVAGLNGDCDTLYTVTLTILPQNASTQEVEISSSELPYQFGSQSLTAAGTYTEVFEDANGCDSTVTLTLTVTSGLNDVVNNLSVSLYPNPTNANATLSVKGLNEDATIIVTDQQGKVISTTKLAKGSEIAEIEMTNLASGVYYVRIQTANAVRTEKLIKK